MANSRTRKMQPIVTLTGVCDCSSESSPWLGVLLPPLASWSFEEMAQRVECGAWDWRRSSSLEREQCLHARDSFNVLDRVMKPDCVARAVSQAVRNFYGASSSPWDQDIAICFRAVLPVTCGFSKQESGIWNRCSVCGTRGSRPQRPRCQLAARMGWAQDPAILSHLAATAEMLRESRHEPR